MPVYSHGKLWLTASWIPAAAEREEELNLTARARPTDALFPKQTTAFPRPRRRRGGLIIRLVSGGAEIGRILCRDSMGRHFPPPPPPPRIV